MMCTWCEKYQKKLGKRASAKTCSLLRFSTAICQLHFICKGICRPKQIHLVYLTFDPLRLWISTIAQNDRNLLKNLNCLVKYPCFKEWAMLFCDLQPRLMHTAINVTIHVDIIHAYAGFWPWPCPWMQLQSPMHAKMHTSAQMEVYMNQANSLNWDFTL